MQPWRGGSATVRSSGFGCIAAGLISPTERPSSSHPPFLHHDGSDDGLLLVDPAGQQPGDHRADDRRHPEQPQLADIFAAGKERRTGASRWIDRGVGDRDRHEMDQGQGQTDRDSSKAGSRTLRRAPNDDEEKKEGHHHFHKKASPEAIFAGAEIAIAVSGKTAWHPARLARCDDPQYRGRDDGRDHLSDDVGDDVSAWAASSAPQADRDRRVEVTARNVTDGVSHGQNFFFEGEGDTEKADPEARKSGSQDSRAAAAEYQPKGAKELGDYSPRHVVVHRSLPRYRIYTLAVEIGTLKNLKRRCGPEAIRMP